MASRKRYESLDHVIGEQLRALRDERNLRQEELAEMVPSWTRDTVAGIEGGRRHVSIEDLLWMSMMLDVPLGYWIPEPRRGVIADVQLGRNVWVDLSGIRSLFDGGHFDQPRPTFSPSPPVEAEAKAARRLGVNRQAIVEASRRLWGHSLTEEREARVLESAPADASPSARRAHRGHITRSLTEELEQALKRRRRKK